MEEHNYDFAQACVDLAERRDFVNNEARAYVEKLVALVGKIKTADRFDRLMSVVNKTPSLSKTYIIMQMAKMLLTERRTNAVTSD